MGKSNDLEWADHRYEVGHEPFSTGYRTPGVYSNKSSAAKGILRGLGLSILLIALTVGLGWFFCDMFKILSSCGG